MSRLGEGVAGEFPVYDNAPLYMRLTLVFPYTTGMLFQNAVRERDGQEGFAEVFRRAPVSTQQIIHPEEYFSNIKPTQPELPAAHLPRVDAIGGSAAGSLAWAIAVSGSLSP